MMGCKYDGMQWKGLATGRFINIPSLILRNARETHCSGSFCESLHLASCNAMEQDMHGIRGTAKHLPLSCDATRRRCDAAAMHIPRAIFKAHPSIIQRNDVMESHNS